MLVSFANNFIYVKGRKVASTSVEMALSPFCGPTDIITPITPADEFDRLQLGGTCKNYGANKTIHDQYIELVTKQRFEEALKTGVHSRSVSRFYNHMSLSQIERLIDIPFEQFTVIVSERRPYEKIISLANMSLSFSQYRGQAMENSADTIRQAIGRLFVKDSYKTVRNIDMYQGAKQYKQKIALRQENLSSCLTQLFRQLDLGEGIQDWPHAKRGTSSDQLPPAEIFTRQQLDLINQDFADEFRIFGYEKI